MAATYSDADRRTVLNALSEIREQLSEERDFRECGATTDLDFRMSDARIAGLKAERSELKEILSDME